MKGGVDAALFGGMVPTDAVGGLADPMLPCYSKTMRLPFGGVIGGNRVEFSDALIPTSSSSSSWGRIKNTFLAHDGRTSP